MDIIDIRDTIDTIRDASAKVEHVLWLFNNAFSSREIHDTIGTMRNMHTTFSITSDKWSSDERLVIDWITKRNEIMTSIHIVEDYVEKITDALNLIPDVTICDACNEARASS